MSLAKQMKDKYQNHLWVSNALYEEIIEGIQCRMSQGCTCAHIPVTNTVEGYAVEVLLKEKGFTVQGDYEHGNMCVLVYWDDV